MQTILRTATRWTVPALVAMLIPSTAPAQDIAQSRDHPLIKRVAGSVIREYHVDDHGRCNIPLGPAQGNRFAESRVVQGRVTTITYAQRPGLSVGDVYREFNQSFGQAGMTSLFTCSDASCGTGPGATNTCAAPWNGTYGQRHFSGSSPGASGAAMVSLHVQAPQYKGMAIATLTVVEVSTPATPPGPGTGGGVSPAFTQQLAGRGFVELDEPLFEPASARFTSQARVTLESVASYLKQNPSVRLFVVNHTDTEGRWQNELTLSRTRAQAVVSALTGKYQIAASRLVPQGLGSFAPVADVRTDAGRKKNTRTILVVME